MKDFYRILEVDRKASIDVIEKAYKVLAKKISSRFTNNTRSKKNSRRKN